MITANRTPKVSMSHSAFHSETDTMISGSSGLDALIDAMQDWDLFAAFYIIDSCTDGKSREPVEWFFEQLQGRVETRFTAEEILP